jgi:aryl-alcohol dehydrogenase-like predicted oxidoreductase
VKLIDAIHDNLRNLGVDKLDVVNLRVGEVLRPSEGSIEEPLTELAERQRQGLIRHLGLSNVTPRQFAEAQKNIAQRDDDAFVDELINAKRSVRTLLPTGRIYSVAIFLRKQLRSSTESRAVLILSSDENMKNTTRIGLITGANKGIGY